MRIAIVDDIKEERDKLAVATDFFKYRQAQ